MNELRRWNNLFFAKGILRYGNLAPKLLLTNVSFLGASSISLKSLLTW